MSNSLWPHGLKHARPPCPSPPPEVCPSSRPLHWWCHPSISSSDHPLLLPLSVFPSLRDFSSELAVCITYPRYWSSDSNSLKGHLVKCKHNIYNCLGNQTIRVTCFTVVVWNETCRISEVCLYYLYRTAKIRMSTDVTSETMQARGSVAPLLTYSKKKKYWFNHSSSILLWLEEACVLYPQLN